MKTLSFLQGNSVDTMASLARSYSAIVVSPSIVGRKLMTSVTMGQVSVIAACSALRVHVSRVYGRSSKEEVADFHASWNIAPMQNMKVLWNWAVRQFPSHAMGVVNHPIYRKMTVSLGVYGSSPEQTPAVGFWDRFIEESFPGGFHTTNLRIVPSNL